jgi:hypothetical protein
MARAGKMLDVEGIEAGKPQLGRLKTFVSTFVSTRAILSG